MSEKLRVYQLAKKLGVTSREIIWAMGQLGAEVRNHMSTVEPGLINGIKAQLRIPVEKPAAEEAPAAPAKRVQAAPSAPVEHPAEAAEQPPPPVEPEEGEVVAAPEVAPLAEKVRRRPGARRPPAEAWAERPRRVRPGRTRLADLRLEREKPRELVIEGPITVGNLAQRLGIRPSEAIKRLIGLGIMAGINQEIDPHTASVLAAEFGVKAEGRGERPAEEGLLPTEDEGPRRLEPRPPVVTVMGHVDHGKTSLLDAIRQTNVTAREAGGITQHIGASTVEAKGRRIVFLDTPGHEAFTAMRARGAQVTDIAVLVVAADDGVMPQTIEAVNHARAAKVPILVAINKIDKPGASPDRVRQQLADIGLMPEEWGGQTVCVPVSAREKKGIDDLLEMLVLMAEMLELKADPYRRARGTIIEARLDRERGPAATVIVQEGTLKVGDVFVAGFSHGRVRAMLDDRGRRLSRAGPSTAVEVLGFSEVPAAGDGLVVVDDERTAREVATRRQERRKHQELELAGRVRLDRLFQQFEEGRLRELNLILKADVQGSLEALSQALEKVEKQEVKIKVIHGGVGAITESDIMLAAASGAIVIGFNSRPEPGARRAAEQEHVDVRTYQVIYDVVDDIRKALEGMLKPRLEEVVLGRAEVRALFRIPRVGTVAGCYVTEGRIVRTAQVRVVRDGSVVHTGPLESLKRFKDDVREVAAGYECGVGIRGFSDIREGDVLEVFTQAEVKP
ncbi:MAG: translation initiation factor IF-2 [Acetobacteraceae bacterium]|nr:translation initiation factor IF-2 [Acetobacteraceae bacterium]